MSKRLLLLNGLSIMAVVCVHAAIWGEISLAWYTGCLFTASNCDRIGVLAYWGLTAVEGIAGFIVPAFLFVSGYFVAYVARGSQSVLTWRMIQVRVKDLLVPYFVWSVVVFICNALRGEIFTPSGYLLRLVYGGADPPYYYVPLLCQFYLLSPLIIPIAKRRPKLMLLASAGIQLGVMSLTYYVSLVAKAPISDMALRILRLPLFPGWSFFFAFGIVSGLHSGRLRQLLQRKRSLLAGAVILVVLSILESEVLYRVTGDAAWRTSPLTVSSSLYAIFFVLCFLAFNWLSGPTLKFFLQLGKEIFGIYLLHWKVLELATLAIVSIVPRAISYQIVLQPVLIVLGVGVPLLFMDAVAKSPARKLYRYLFG
jgi:membrane-bound acyltransferase YfiQ involved in biofilm formation